MLYGKMSSYEDIMKLALERGFYFQSCEIYADAPAGFWEYGPNGVSIKNKFIDLWRRELVRYDGMVEIDGSQIMSKSVFIASGHIGNFTDPIIECIKCNSIFRADKYIIEKTGENVPERMADEDINAIIRNHGLRCPNCNGEFGSVSRFNMMFKVGIGPGAEEAYLRPETCQTIFVDFPRVYKTMRGKLPIGIAQLGKSFRNEIAPRQSLLRLREFYQAEVEIFCNPAKLDDISNFDEASIGWLELVACNYRSDHDLKGHSIVSKQNLEVIDPSDQSKILPHVFELSMGIDRSIYAILEHSYFEDMERDDRIALKLKPYLAPILVGVLPLMAKQGLDEKAQKIYSNLKRDFDVFYDQSGSIGRRYRRLEEIGAPFAVTIDKQTMEDDTVTVRYRDTMQQVRIKEAELHQFFHNSLQR